MSTEDANRDRASRASGWIVIACEAAAVIAWALLVLLYQYQVAALGPYQLRLDAIFLLAVFGVILTRAFRRSGVRVLFRAGAAIIALAVSLFVAERVARADFRRAQSSGNARDFIGRHQQGPLYRRNSLGFRDREIPPATVERYRIAIVGDSLTWGQGVEEDERYSNLIGQFLGPRYEVFNFGIPGNNMPEHLDVLTKALSVSPNFVLLQLYVNDWETRAMRRPRPYRLLPRPLDDELVGSSLLYDLLNGQWVRLQEAVGITESYAHYMESNLRDPNAPNARLAYGQLREFFERARGAHVGVGAVLFPATDALGPNGKSYPFAYLHEGVRRTCADAGVPCLDLLPLFSQTSDQRSLWVSPFDAHPNAIANRRAANAIEATFVPSWPF
jgi:lysophospholipase L1-like esterase